MRTKENTDHHNSMTIHFRKFLFVTQISLFVRFCCHDHLLRSCFEVVLTRVCCFDIIKEIGCQRVEMLLWILLGQKVFLKP